MHKKVPYSISMPILMVSVQYYGLNLLTENKWKIQICKRNLEKLKTEIWNKWGMKNLFNPKYIKDKIFLNIKLKKNINIICNLYNN